MELTEGIFSPILISPINVEPSIINKNWPRFNVTSEVSFNVNSPLVPCFLSKVNKKPTGLLTLSFDRSLPAWEHVNKKLQVP